ncbi:hypothetical protein AB3X28_12025 [Raoultella terrigena]|uniref:hypothetical protein n=1 Tax=Raoultella terrigena TaxID=577 RepID=UPI00349F31C3
MIENYALRAAANGERDDIAPALFAAELLAARERITQLERQLATPVRLPVCCASPVCEIEAGYAAGVSDCRNAIRQAGYPIEGDD